MKNSKISITNYSLLPRGHNKRVLVVFNSYVKRNDIILLSTKALPVSPMSKDYRLMSTRKWKYRYHFKCTWYRYYNLEAL